MFATIDEIYNHIGQAMFNVLPDNWDRAWFEAILLDPTGAMQSRQRYISNNETHSFNVNKINDIPVNSGCGKAFYALYHLMQKNKDDTPWNKARFEINNKGDFDIEFKLDEDFKWCNNLDPDGKEYDELDIDIIVQIKSWEGLPEDFPRYWKK